MIIDVKRVKAFHFLAFFSNGKEFAGEIFRIFTRKFLPIIAHPLLSASP